MKNLIFIFISCGVFAQNSNLELKYYFKMNSNGSEVVYDCSLKYNAADQKSLFTLVGFMGNPENKVVETKDINGNVSTNTIIYEDESYQTEYQKNFKEKSLIEFTDVYREDDYFLISEKLPKLNWEVLKDTLTILKYNTQKAKVNFRGRNYFAWFTSDIFISDGPFKFHGLPGLILKVESEDKNYVYEAYEIAINSKKGDLPFQDLVNRYPNNKKITIKDKWLLTKSNIEKERKFKMSSGNGVVAVKIENTGLELNIDDVINEN